MSENVLFVSAFQPFVSRNILNTGVLDMFLEKKIKVVIFVPLNKVQYYKEVYKGPQIIIEGVDTSLFANKINIFFKNIADLFLDTNTKFFHKKTAYFENGRFFKYFLSRLTTFFISRIPFLLVFFREADLFLNDCRIFDRYFDTYKPRAIFLTDIFGDADVCLIKGAKRKRIRTTGMVLSWDNATSKTIIRVIPDILIVQNNLIRDEVISLHRVDPNIIKVSGIPHYDYYKSRQKLAGNRESFLKSIGLDPRKKIVLVAPAGKKFIDTDWQILQILKEASNKGAIKDKCQFFVRVHPSNKVLFHEFVPDSNFVIQDSGVSFGTRNKDNELTKDDVDFLIEMITFSDLVINTLSSIVIDACVLNRPVITIGFDGREKDVPFERSVGRYLSEENMKKLLSVGGAPVVFNEDELIRQINSYFKNPNLDISARRLLVLQQCGELDGSAKYKICSWVLGL